MLLGAIPSVTSKFKANMLLTLFFRKKGKFVSLLKTKAKPVAKKAARKSYGISLNLGQYKV